MAGQSRSVRTGRVQQICLPSHLLSGPALLALALSQEARGIRGLDVLRRSIDRAPPVHV